MLDKPAAACCPEAGCGDEDRLKNTTDSFKTEDKTWGCFSSEEAYNLLHHGMMHSLQWWPQPYLCKGQVGSENAAWRKGSEPARVKELIFICLAAITPAF